MTVKKNNQVEIKTCLGVYSNFLNCSGRKSISDFYMSNNVELHRDGYLFYCKDCCNKLSEHYLKKSGSIQSALFYTCSTLSVPFIKECYLKTTEMQDKLKNKKYFGVYYGNLIKKTTMKEKWKDFSDTDVDLKDISNDLISEEVVQLEKEKFEMDWGIQTASDYKFLENTFNKYTKGVEFVNPQQEDLYRDLCRDRLILRQMNDNRYTGTEDIAKVQTRIANLMKILKADEFESNKPKTASELTLFEKIRQCDEKNVADVYSKPSRYYDLNQIAKYNKDLVLRPMLNTLVGHRDFDINIEDVDNYDLS